MTGSGVLPPESSDDPIPTPTTKDGAAPKRSAAVALHNTTPSRLRATKRPNDGNENADRQVTQVSPTQRSTPLLPLDSQSGLPTPSPRPQSDKQRLRGLHFKRKIAGSLTMTSRPIDPHSSSPHTQSPLSFPLP
ncbi:hypothetical protein M422DRAFT_253259 [Sphaerobolus stellatus SS14]|uniref:Uncharacterized protein n=1 Tax=Sphaerobolus stellatus (strain SS14) TaxID=990650 RepID=A0A0C9V8S1_SPHS4|nr:hypothetical protein M422DRAFT_253259 [Sphaerobolus stellatus SS14]